MRDAYSMIRWRVKSLGRGRAGDSSVVRAGAWTVNGAQVL